MDGGIVNKIALPGGDDDDAESPQQRPELGRIGDGRKTPDVRFSAYPHCVFGQCAGLVSRWIKADADQAYLVLQALCLYLALQLLKLTAQRGTDRFAARIDKIDHGYAAVRCEIGTQRLNRSQGIDKYCIRHQGRIFHGRETACGLAGDNAKAIGKLRERNHASNGERTDCDHGAHISFQQAIA